MSTAPPALRLVHDAGPSSTAQPKHVCVLVRRGQGEEPFEVRLGIGDEAPPLILFQSASLDAANNFAVAEFIVLLKRCQEFAGATFLLKLEEETHAT